MDKMQAKNTPRFETGQSIYVSTLPFVSLIDDEWQFLAKNMIEVTIVEIEEAQIIEENGFVLWVYRCKYNDGHAWWFPEHILLAFNNSSLKFWSKDDNA